MTKGFEQPNDLSPEQLRALVQAMAHPVQAKVLFAVAGTRQDGVSIRQISDRIREPRRKVRYHLDALLERGLVRIASRRSHRGVVERFYRAEVAPWLTTEQLDGFDEDQVRQMSAQILKAVLGDASLAVGAKMFGIRSGHVVVRMSAEVDEQGWGELGSLQERTLRESQAIIERSRDRLSGSDSTQVSALVALLLFEVPSWPES